MYGKWKFRKMDKSEKLVDPIQNQFFTTNIVGGLTSALVRETIQNSLDAKTTEEEDSEFFYPVEVRFLLSGQKNAIGPEKMGAYFDGLTPHIHAKNNGLQETKIPDFTQPMPYLLIEDYNTVGLEGDPLEFEDPPEGNKTKHNFFWFWRNVGRSDKEHDARGRWGLGKAVYPKSSNIHTYFGLTIRESDESTLLMGESILKIHKVEGQIENSYPYGYYGEFKDKKSEDFVSPLENEKSVDNFISDFGLNRLDKEGRYFCGLSLVIPYPSENITKSELIKATVIQYFYPIILGQLTITVEDENTKEPIVIKADTIDSVVDEIVFIEDDTLNSEKLRKLFHFARWVLALEEDEYITLLKPDSENVPVWYQDWYLDGDLKEKLKEKIEQFDRGERVAFNVPVKVHVEGKSPRVTWFKVFIEKDEDLSDSDCHFIRDGITIVGVKPPRRKDVRALVVIEDQLLSKLLGDAENPAHTEWSKDSPNFVGKYVHGDKVISFVINSLDRLHSWLMKPAEGLDEDILEDIFYIELIDETNTGKDDDSSDDDGDTTGEPKSPKNGKPLPMIVRKIDGGVVIKPNPKAEVTPKTVYVKLGYMLVRGNPLKRYNTMDFNLANDSINIVTRNVSVVNQNENYLDFDVTGNDFEVSITGFDSERDLYIKTDYDD